MHSVTWVAKLSFRSAVRRVGIRKLYLVWQRAKMIIPLLTTIFVRELTEAVLDEEEELHDELERKGRCWIICTRFALVSRVIR